MSSETASSDGAYTIPQRAWSRAIRNEIEVRAMENAEILNEGIGRRLNLASNISLFHSISFVDIQKDLS